MRTLLPISNTKQTWLRNSRKIVAIQPQEKDLHEKQFVYKKYAGRFGL